jgi:hypothetical protein
MRAVSAAIALVMLAPTARPQAGSPAVSIVEATVVSLDRGRRTITVREASGAVRTLNVARAASLAAATAGSPVVLAVRGSTVTAIDPRGGARPQAQEVPQLRPGAIAPQNRPVPQLPPGSDAPQARPIPQVPAVSPAPAPRPAISPASVSPRPAISPRSVSPRPAISPVTGPSPRPVVLPSDPPGS